MDLSVVIVNYNVRYFLEQCLLSVRKAVSGIKCEIFVVDNNSADGSCAMVARKFPEVLLIRNRKNRGFSAACNQAIELSKGRYILLLNPDTVLEEDTFSKCITFMDTHPDAGAIGVKMLDGNGRMLPESKRAFPAPATALFKMAGLSVLFPKSRYFNRYYLGHLDNSTTAEADIISGAFMFIRREAIEKTGLLDESFFMYGEDIDLSYRLIKAGYRNYFFPGVKIIHYKGESTRKSDINYTIHFYRAMIVFTDKHFGSHGFGMMKFLIRLAIVFSGVLSFMKSIIHSLITTVRTSYRRRERVAIISNDTEFKRIKNIAESAYRLPLTVGRVSLKTEDLGEEVLGSVEQIDEIIRINRVTDVVISTNGLNASGIIDLMQMLSDKKVTIKIAPDGENYFIGSRSLSQAKILS